MSETSDTSRRSWLNQFVKFGLVGVLNTVVDFVVFVALIWLSFHYAAAQTAAYAAGMVNSYMLNNRFTFGAHKGEASASERRKRQIRFVVWNAAMLALSIALLAAATELLALSDIWAKAGVTAIIVFVNFYGSKKWVFTGNKAVESR